MSKKSVSILLSVGIFLLTVWLVEYWIGWAVVWSGFSNLSVFTLCLAAIPILFSAILRALRIYLGFPIVTKHPFVCLFQLSALHTLLNNLLPMRLGEIAFPVLMKRRYSVALRESAAQLLLYRCLDLLVLVSLGIGVYLYSELLYLLPIFAILVTFGLVLVNPIKQLVLSTLPQSWKKLRELLQGLPTKGKHFYFIVLITCALWLSKIGAFVVLVMSVSELNLLQASIAAIGADLSSILPIHGVAGTGSFEGAFVLSGKLFALDTVQLLTVGTQLHLFILFMSLLIWAISQVLLSVIKQTSRVVLK